MQVLILLVDAVPKSPNIGEETTETQIKNSVLLQPFYLVCIGKSNEHHNLQHSVGNKNCKPIIWLDNRPGKMD